MNIMELRPIGPEAVNYQSEQILHGCNRTKGSAVAVRSGLGVVKKPSDKP
jgi:hypothetical protein